MSEFEQQLNSETEGARGQDGGFGHGLVPQREQYFSSNL